MDDTQSLENKVRDNLSTFGITQEQFDTNLANIRTAQGRKPSDVVPTVDGSKINSSSRTTIPTTGDTSKIDNSLATIFTNGGANAQDLFNMAQNLRGGEITEKYGDITDNLLSARVDQAQRRKDTLREQERAGLPELEAEKALIESNFDTLEAARNSRLINETGGQTTISKRTLANRQNAIQREYGLQVADNRINQLVVSGKINAATQLIDAKLDLKYGDLEAEIDLYNAQLEAIKPLLDNETAQLAEQRQFLLNESSNLIADARQRDKELELTKATALQNAVDRGATPLQIAQIQDATSLEQVAATGFLTSAMAKSQLYGQQLSNQLTQEGLKSQRITNALAGDQDSIDALGFDPRTINFNASGTDDLVANIIAGSSQYGDKRLTDSQLEKIQQSVNALGSLESLQALLSSGDDGIDLTGPITGRVRTLLTQLGGDANAAAINATIQGLIPTVARGIFGEVGVLTDADIANYRKTIPNLNTTEGQNKLISLVMYDVLGRSLKNTLVTNAQNQTNVSNFLSTYNDVMTRIDQAKLDMGVTSFSGMDDSTFIDSAPEQATTTTSATTATPFFNVNEFNNWLGNYYGQ